MDLMSIAQLLGNFGEFFGAIAVVVTLGYLAFQIRQNTQQMRAQAYVQLADAQRALLSDLRNNPEIVDRVIETSYDFDEQPAQDQRTTIFYWQDEGNFYQLAYVLWQQGAIDEETYASYEEYFLSLLLQSGRRRWWDDWSIIANKQFQDRINAKLSELEELGASDVSGRFPMFRPS